MSEFVCDDEGNVIIDFIGKYENLSTDFRTVCQRAGLPSIELPHLNKSTSGEYRKYYTNETRDFVAKMAQKDIELFGYDF